MTRSADAANAPLLVGRARELAVLRDHLAAAFDGRGGLVVIGGEAGIGKTALVEALGREAAAQGALVLTGSCYDLIATPPYGPWLALAAGYRQEDDLPPLPSLLAGPDGIGDAGGPPALFVQVGGFFAAVSARRPIVLILEDLHWADPASLELARALGHQVAGLRLLLILTYRTRELTRHDPFYQTLPALVREAAAERIELRRLDEAELRALVASRYRLPEAEEVRLVAYLQGHAEGIPFYAHELLRTLEEEALLSPAADGWAVGELDKVRVPALLQQVVDERLGRLGEAIREPLSVAAIIGQEVPLELWRAVLDAPEEAVLATVERAIDAHILEAMGDGVRVRFGHALIRAALYEGVFPPRRRGWHRRVAEALAAAPGPDPDAVAYHFRQAQDARAGEWLVRAGERAQRAYAWLTATERYLAALALLPDDAGRTLERGWLLYRIGRLLRLANPDQSVAYLEEAERAAIAAQDRVLAAFARFDRGTVRSFVGDFPEGIAEMAAGDADLDALLAEGLRLDEATAAWVADALPQYGSVSSHVPAHWRTTAELHPRRGTLAMWLAAAGRFVEAARIAEPYVAQFAVRPPAGALLLSSAADAHVALATVHAAMGRPDEARRAYASAREAYRAIDHHVMVGLVNAGELLHVVLPYLTDDPAERRRLIGASEEGFDRAGPRSVGQPSPFAQIALLVLEGDWAEARRLATDAIAHPTVGNRHLAAQSLGRIAFHQGEPDLAWVQVQAVLPDGPATKPGRSFFRAVPPLQRLAADLALAEGNLPVARAWLEAHDRWLDWSESVFGRADGDLRWAAYRRAAGDPSAAHRTATSALRSAARPRQPLSLLAAHRLLGQLETEAKRYDEAERQIQTALALADACGAPFERARTLLALAELRAATGQKDAATTLLDEVRRLCTPLGSARTLAQAEALAARLAAGPPQHPAGLTHREVEVLQLVSQGLTDAQVAAQLSISPRTVGQHLHSIYAKLEVSSRAAATRFAVANGLV